MNETHFAEIEKTLLYISDARRRAAETARDLKKAGADSHLILALQDTERDLDAAGRRLMQETYFAVPREQLSLDERAEKLTIS